ncbi:hypothetical protein QFC22_005921 [Naganishia vaughanmartiniae]|uniref:Uncharacterized protein n=1 Tax=Naganishia vaughanmartiniae TaxID=1424756 RepID=A0ACC2WQD3_9TREE|nr:hypothetical protein QFC22_005921 [Naganishia vaughanmartiniae]
MSKNFNPFPSVRRDRQRQLEREKQDSSPAESSAEATPLARSPVTSTKDLPLPPSRPVLPGRTSTEQTIRSATLSPERQTLNRALYSPPQPSPNEHTTVRSSGLGSTDDEAFELYLSKQKELKAMRAKLAQNNGRVSSEGAGTVAAEEVREMQSAYVHTPGRDALGLETTEEEQEQEVAQGLDEEIELGHMQEIVEGLWIGDVVAARDERALNEAGITAVLTLLRQKLPPPPPGILSLPIPIDDTPDADILCHLDGCVRWIADVLESEQAGGEDADADAKGVQKKGAVLVHCQAGMSRSATVVAAYLMKTLNISPDDAVEMIREKRPVVYPSETFRAQLELWYKAKFKATVKDRDIRQWYMERTAAQVRNGGELEEDATLHMAKYPATPTASTPATPVGGYGKRKIRCKACRRNLATRDHMMDHILDQSPFPAPRSRAPSVSITSLSVGDEDPDLTASKRASRPPSFSNSSRPALALSMSRTPTLDSDADKAVPSPRRDDSPFQDPQQPFVKKAATNPGIMKGEAGMRTGPPVRRVLDPRTLAASLPPQLAALRAGVPPSAGAGVPSPQNSAPAGFNPKTPFPFIPFPVEDISRRSSSPSSINSSSSSPLDAVDESALSTSPDKGNAGVKPVDSRLAAKRTSTLAMTPTEPGSRSRRESTSSLISASRRGSSASLAGVSAANWPILVNPKCSGYFVEPLTWMEPMLASGALVGKITCPNDKCGAKIGSFDWAGVQCGCKEWVTPGFCIHRSKVDEVW